MCYVDSQGFRRYALFFHEICSDPQGLSFSLLCDTILGPSLSPMEVLYAVDSL